MNEAKRVHEGRYETERWGGTIADVLALIKLASSEVAKRSGGKPPSYDHNRINFDDGHATFKTVEEFEVLASDIDAANVRSIDVSLFAHNEPGEWVSIKFGSFNGLSVGVHSPDRIWAHGLADVLAEQAARGALPEYSGRRPFRWWEWICLSLLVGGVSVVGLLTAFGTISVSSGLLLGYVVFALLCFPLVNTLDRRIPNARLRLRAEGTDAEPATTPGLPVRVQEAIRKRPLLSVALVFLFAIASNKASELL